MQRLKLKEEKKIKKALKNAKKGEDGITLIALVITIIILIVLVGITSSILTGENRGINTSTRGKGKKFRINSR